MIWTSEYFYGNKISDYGLKNGYVDYRTLAKAFDAVLNNEIYGFVLEHIGNWIKYIQNINDNIPIILVANKCDLYEERIVTQKEGNDLAINYNFTFVETSAKNNINVKTTFVKICEEIIAKAEMRMNSIDSDIMDDDDRPYYLRELIPYKDKRKNKKCCCC